LLNQWKHEIETRVKGNYLSVHVFHSSKKIDNSRELSKYDVVLTTYGTVLSTTSGSHGCLSRIVWNRIVLDEGHIIRNHKAQQSDAVCQLQAKHRWVLTGTPVQNKEFDIYAIMKFLKCHPFDDVKYWRSHVRGKDGNSPRVSVVLKATMLRRTKKQLQELGKIEPLPEKHFENIHIELNEEERFIYNAVMSFSQSVFAQFIEQRMNKDGYKPEADILALSLQDKQKMKKLREKFQDAFGRYAHVDTSTILVLLLRLRQICCHPALIRHALSTNEFKGVDELGAEQDGVEGVDDDKEKQNELDLKEGLKSMNLDHGDKQIDPNAPVFDPTLASSKHVRLMEMLKETVMQTDEKAIIVSQWTSHLDIISGFLDKENISYCELTGKVKIADRNDVIVDFNNPKSTTKVMLLSLTAGGVGLNLVGANYLFLMDLHWNPQMEQQAQDRIYRFGQKKEVKIYK